MAITNAATMMSVLNATPTGAMRASPNTDSMYQLRVVASVVARQRVLEGAGVVVAADAGQIDARPTRLLLRSEAGEQHGHHDERCRWRRATGCPWRYPGRACRRRWPRRARRRVEEMSGRNTQASTSRAGHKDACAAHSRRLHRDLHVLRLAGDAGELAEPFGPEHERGGRCRRPR